MWFHCKPHFLLLWDEILLGWVFQHVVTPEIYFIDKINSSSRHSTCIKEQLFKISGIFNKQSWSYLCQHFKNTNFLNQTSNHQAILNTKQRILTYFLFSNCFQYLKLLNIIKRQESSQKELNFYRAHIYIRLLCWQKIYIQAEQYSWKVYL